METTVIVIYYNDNNKCDNKDNNKNNSYICVLIIFGKYEYNNYSVIIIHFNYNWNFLYPQVHINFVLLYILWIKNNIVFDYFFFYDNIFYVNTNVTQKHRVAYALYWYFDMLYSIVV